MPNTLKLDITSLENHLNAAQQLLNFAGKQTVFLFDAPMGNGKTTFIKSLCKCLGVTNAMSSPTYSIVNEYQTPTHKVFHFDLYRLNKAEELYDIGFEDYLNDVNPIFIEWPAFAMPFLQSYIKININIEENYRYLYAEIFETHGQN